MRLALNRVLSPCPSTFSFRWAGPRRPRRMAPKPARARTWKILPPSRVRAGNVRAGTGTGLRFGHRVFKSAATGWAIPPDPQQARGGQAIPVQGGP